MNSGITLDFYRAIFKERKMEMKSEQEEKQQEQREVNFPTILEEPTRLYDHLYLNTFGLNITITPSEEDLRIPDQSKQDAEEYSEIIKAYGVLLYDLCEVVSDGILVFFPSFSIMA